MLANTTDQPIDTETDLDGDYDMFAVDDTRSLDNVYADARNFVLPCHSVYLIRN